MKQQVDEQVMRWNNKMHSVDYEWIRSHLPDEGSIFTVNIVTDETSEDYYRLQLLLQGDGERVKR